MKGEIVIDKKNIELLKAINKNVTDSQKDFSLVCETILRQIGKEGVKYSLDLEKGIFIPQEEKTKE